MRRGTTAAHGLTPGSTRRICALLLREQQYIVINNLYFGTSGTSQRATDRPDRATTGLGPELLVLLFTHPFPLSRLPDPSQAQLALLEPEFFARS